MTDGKRAVNGAQNAARRATSATPQSRRFTEEERAAMRERARETRAANAGETVGESDLLAKIAEMTGADRALAERLHALIKASAPELSAKTWYGFPAYAKDGNLICFFQPSTKFKTRYAELGFSDKANLDDGHLWPTRYALTKLTDADEVKIRALLNRALS
jgi:uncharacterized protein YdhG (YjbR/CyaY superfamily)